MKILLLNQTFYPDVMATGQHLSDLASELVKRGHAVTVVTGRRAYDGKGVRRSEDGGRREGGAFPKRETWRGVEIHRVYSTGYRKKTKWRRALDFGTFILSCCVRLARLPRHEVVVALTTPPLISFIGAWRAKLWRARFCYWVMDFNPDQAIAAGWLRADSAPARILERMSRFSLRRADCIVALDRFMRDRIVAKGIAPEKIAVMPPWSHDDEVCFDPVGRERFRKTHGLDGKFVVMYSGNHSPVHPLDTLLRAAERLRDNSEVVFCFVGGGSEFERVQQWVDEGKGNALSLPYQPLNQLGASLSAADAQVVVMGEAMLGLVHPCKIYNILAVGAPVIYVGPKRSHVTEILDLLGEAYPSIRVPHGDPDALANQIQDLRKKTANRSRAMSTIVPTAYGKGVLLPKLIAVLEGFRLPGSARGAGGNSAPGRDLLSKSAGEPVNKTSSSP
jgi:colanic acid biosynthesis glycosyl transferase WcaI